MQTSDLTFIALAWLGSSIIALPLLAFAARFGLVPLLEAVADLHAAGRAPRQPTDIERRLAGVERGLASLAASIDRIAASRSARPAWTAAAVPLADSLHTTGATRGHPAH
ncbi:MAG TPA: hypothetical protein VFS20_19040 [Longimicrobium sp.]|nr:hypothetical protein [Longimicrobium sp.]